MNTSVITSDSKIAIIILAGGSSSRLGKPKQLLQYQNKSLIKHAVKTASKIECKPIVVVTGFLHEELVEEIKAFPVTIAHNPDWEKGMGTSIGAGIRTLNQLENFDSIDAVLILLCDQPLINQQHLKNLINLFYQNKRNIAATGYADTSGVPAVFDKHVFSILENLPADRGAQWLLKHYKEEIIVVPFEGATIDIDTEEDYLRLIELERKNKT